MEFREIFSRAQIDARVRHLGKEISEYYGDEPLVCVCVLKGAYAFFTDLMRSLTIHPIMDFVRLSSYADQTSRQSRMVFSKDMEIDVKDKHVLIVEDIVDTGHSMRFLRKVLEARSPRSVRIAAMVDKRERREVDVAVDYVGFPLQKGFIVGYGLDYAERFRELDGIYELILPETR
ncbi:MAG: hypoxanthine phosphoribosyltransferase [Desulfomicrobiaceae bacterium]|jgi:hypoxanthine phosphoribosyltransferase|nr:hypoxanthine phosphoribosyltransferase [Desulfomicrobiaceae bacterium]MDI3493680.1 hypoxanthine phosphoribosyltransferase [Desulfomicrobiaceae bacterium]MDK2872260.1 hypoxanthine phosphoribosyltransferase [Desulfomicrobiaceae bacterium]HCF06187.1 hypoxanthine phosphoribosyltransferase [Desulfomicrobiaceae bacterium]